MKSRVVEINLKVLNGTSLEPVDSGLGPGPYPIIQPEISMITFVSSETFRITRQSITRDLHSLSRLGSIHSRNSTRSLRLSAPGHFNPTKRLFSHLRKAHSTSLPSSRTPNTRLPVSICLRPYATYSNSILGMAISKSAPTDIIKGLSAKYDKAIESGDLLFFPSTNTTYEENGVEVC